MTIETKYNRGEEVIIIYNNKIIKVTVRSIKYERGNVGYTLLVSKAKQLIDSDTTVDLQEDEVFKTPDELIFKHLGFPKK